MNTNLQYVKHTTVPLLTNVNMQTCTKSL